MQGQAPQQTMPMAQHQGAQPMAMGYAAPNQQVAAPHQTAGHPTMQQQYNPVQQQHAMVQPQGGFPQMAQAQTNPVNPVDSAQFEEHSKREREKERRREEHQRRVEEEQLQKRQKKLKRQKEHEERMQKAQQEKIRKKKLRLQKVQEDKRRHAERDARAINVQLDMESLTGEVRNKFSKYGEIEQVKWDQFTCSFNILFKEVDSANKSLEDGRATLDCPATMQSRLVRGWCIHFPDPEHTDPNKVGPTGEPVPHAPKDEPGVAAPPAGNGTAPSTATSATTSPAASSSSTGPNTTASAGVNLVAKGAHARGGPPNNVPAGASAVNKLFRDKVANLFARFGMVKRIVRMRGFLVVELDSCDAVFRIEKAAREEGDSLKIDGEVLEPILTGVPKRSVEKVLARF